MSLIAFIVGVIALSIAVISHISYKQAKNELDCDFIHFKWDKESPVNFDRRSPKSEPKEIWESRQNWNKLKAKRDDLSGRRNGALVISAIAFGTFLNALKNL